MMKVNGYSIVSPETVVEKPILIVAATLFSLAFPQAACHAADDILLRDLTAISNRTVESFDPDGVKLDDGKVLGWDAIENATVANDQEGFDKLLKQLSEPLYRIRQRLKIGDYASLEETADALYPLYKTRKSATAYMVVQAVMWSRLAVGKRESAVEPFLRAFDLLEGEKLKPDLPGPRRLQYEAATGLCSELLPIWFDQDAAAKAFAEVSAAAPTLQVKRHGLYAYAASLAIAGNELNRVAPFLATLKNGNNEIKQLQACFELQYAISSDGEWQAALSNLASLESQLTGVAKPTAWYHLGVAQLKSQDREQQQQGVLNLLRLPAVYHQTNPEVAAAGVYHAMKAMQQQDRLTDSIALRKELLSRFGSTAHAVRLKNEE